MSGLWIGGILSIAAIVLLIGANVWAWKLVRKLRRSAAISDQTIRRFQGDETRLRCKVWELRGDEWRENMAWCGGGYNPHLSTLDHAIMLMEQLAGAPRSIDSRTDEEIEREMYNDPSYLQYLKDMEEAEDELEALCPGGQNN